MKKIISFLTLVLIAICVNAQVESVYLQDCTVQAGAKAVIKVIVTHDTSKGCIGSMQFNYSFDDGIIVRDNGQDVVGVGATTVNDKTNFVLLGGMESTTAAAPDGACVCVFNIDIPADMTLGEHPMSISNIMAVYEDGITAFELDQVESTMTVQKSAVIEPLDANNAIEIIPFEFTGGGNFDEPINAAILMKSESYVKNLEFDFELPAGISVPSIEEDGDVIYAEPELENNKGAVPAEITMNEDGTYHYSLSGTSTKYIYAADEMTQFSTLPLMSENPVADGVYTIKIYNISMTTKNDKFEGGNYYASVIVGQPAQEEAILYGHFTSDAASTFTTALKNVAIADVTAATVDEDAKFTDVLVNENGGNSYYTRTSANYGTTVLPLDLTTDNVAELYRVESMDANSIVITEAENIPANTPCIFKGTINVEGATPILGVPSEQGLGQTTYKGTYEATSVGAGAGYYIASNGKFYNDGASIRPFRAYFEGCISGVKSLRVLLDDATGLKDITDQFSKEDIYNLQGIRMNNVQKGINIKGGKKVLVK